MQMLNWSHRQCRECDALQPTQYAKLGPRMAKTMKDHHPDQGFHIHPVAHLLEESTQLGQSQLAPNLLQGPDIPQGASCLVGHGGDLRQGSCPRKWCNSAGHSCLG